MHFTGLNGSRSLRGQWSTFDSNFSRQSSKSLQTTPPLTPSRRSASTKFKSSGSMTGCHEESLDSVDDRPPTRSSSGRQKNARGEQDDDDTASCCIFFKIALLVVVQGYGVRIYGLLLSTDKPHTNLLEVFYTGIFFLCIFAMFRH